MKTEKIIALLELAGKELKCGATHNDCIAMAKALQEEIALKNARTVGKADLYRAMKAVIKNANGKSGTGAVMQHGMQYATDGYMAIENGGTPVDLPSPENKPIDVHKAMCVTREKGNWALQLQCPTIAEIKSNITLAKARAKADGHKKVGVLYNFGGNAPLVNAELLLPAVLAAGEDCNLTAEERLDKQGKPIGNLWFESADGTVKVLLLPVRHKDGDTPEEGFSYTYTYRL